MFNRLVGYTQKCNKCSFYTYGSTDCSPEFKMCNSLNWRYKKSLKQISTSNYLKWKKYSDFLNIIILHENALLQNMEKVLMQDQ